MARVETVDDDFSGVIPGIPPRVSWTVPPERREEKMGDLTFAGNLGKICESGVLRRWTGALNVGGRNDHLIEAARLALKEMRGGRRRLRKTIDMEMMTPHLATAALFQAMGKPLELFNKSGPGHDGFRYGLRVADAAYGLGDENFLWRKYHELPYVGGEIGPRVRYLGEATAILLGELVSPTLNLKRGIGSKDGANEFIINKTFPVPDGHSVQFDGLVVSRDLAGLNGSLRSDDLFLHESMGVYSIWEMKCLFRANEGDRDGVAPGTLRWYIKDMRKRLGQLAIYYLEKHKRFNFPDFMTMCVLRGFAPPLVRHVPFRSLCMTEWAESLETQQIERPPKDRARAGLLINELQRQAGIWRVWEKDVALGIQEEMRASLVNGNLSQGELI